MLKKVMEACFNLSDTYNEILITVKGIKQQIALQKEKLVNAIGAAAGGMVLSLGLNYAAVSMIGAVLAGIGLILVFIQIKLSRKHNAQYQQCPQA